MLESRTGDLSRLASNLDAAAAELGAAIKLAKSAPLVERAMPGARSISTALAAARAVDAKARGIVQQLGDSATAAVETERQFNQTDSRQAQEMSSVWLPTGSYGYGAGS